MDGWTGWTGQRMDLDIRVTAPGRRRLQCFHLGGRTKLASPSLQCLVPCQERLCCARPMAGLDLQPGRAGTRVQPLPQRPPTSGNNLEEGEEGSKGSHLQDLPRLRASPAVQGARTAKSEPSPIPFSGLHAGQGDADAPSLGPASGTALRPAPPAAPSPSIIVRHS